MHLAAVVRRVLISAVLASPLAAVGLAAPALADYPVVPAFLHACPGATDTESVPIEARRADFNPPNFANGETLTFSTFGTPFVSSGSGTATITDNNLTLPSDWTTFPFGVYAADKAAMTVSYTAPADASAFSFVFMSVNLDVSGNLGTEEEEPQMIDVMIDDCAPPPTPTPTPSPSPTPTPSPSPIETPSASPSTAPSASPSEVPSASPSQSAPASPSDGPVTIGVSDPTTVRGEQVTVSGSGAQAGSTVDLWLHSAVVHLGSTVAAGDGSYSALVTIPAGTAPGAHTIEATGTDPADGPFSVNVAITVADAATPPATATAAPGGSDAQGGPMAGLLVGLGLASFVGGLAASRLNRRRSTRAG